MLGLGTCVQHEQGRLKSSLFLMGLLGFGASSPAREVMLFQGVFWGLSGSGAAPGYSDHPRGTPGPWAPLCSLSEPSDLSG